MTTHPNGEEALCNYTLDTMATLRAILMADPVRTRILDLVRSLGLPDCWVGAGFVRDAVWDHCHGRTPRAPAGDIDVLWFDPGHATRADDSRQEDRLRGLGSGFDWSVKNQARMHERNGDAPYRSVTDAMRHWPETATAVAVRQIGAGVYEVAAPFGLDDLFGLVLRPGPRFTGAKHPVYLHRVASKGWLANWPRLRMEPG